MKLRLTSFSVLSLVLLMGMSRIACAATSLATSVSGLYYTGLTSSGTLAAGGTADANWNVTYASINGGESISTQNMGDAYVISSQNLPTSYVDNTSYAQWITAPGAVTSSTGGTANTGGAFLPGNGSELYGRSNGYDDTSLGVYIYTLQFTINGTGTVGSVVTNDVAITLTIAADDNALIYVNPAGNGSYIPETKSGNFITPNVDPITSAWTNTSSVTLANYTDYTSGIEDNTTFKIGTNTLVVVVENTNSNSYGSTSTQLNASGFMLYQTGSAILIDGRVVPEVNTWIPIAGALGLYGCLALCRSRRRSSKVDALGIA